jgi:myo-inositol 2-dehydrogenase / D-chiro-inositol 1-dehydrogenase
MAGERSMDVAIGVIGLGIMGGDHARTLASVTKGATLAAVFDKDRDRTTAVAAATGARIHAAAEALIADRDVDAVLVASPDATHEALVLACLNAGKPVLCEKPLAPTSEECLRILAAEAGLGRRLVQVGFMRRFDPGYRAMRAALASEEIGAPLVMHCVHRNAEVPPSFDSGMLISNSAVHEIDIARWLLDDEFAAASVFRPAPANPGGLVDPQFIVLETRRGVLVDIEVFVNARYGYDVRAELVGQTGTLTLAPRPPIRLRRSGQETLAFAEDWRAHFAAAYRNQLQAWVDSIRTGYPKGASAWDGYAATATAQACLNALATGERVQVALEPRPLLYG